MPKQPRVAAAIVLVRGTGASLEVYLAERAPQLRFFGGYHAFIGGVRDAVDGPDVDGSDREPLRACALRELFEETGVLVAPELVPPAERDAVRQELLADRTDGWAARIDGAAPAERLREFCRITTPPFAPVRYATAFFVAELHADEEPVILDGELIGGSWWKPAEALAAWRRGEVQIVPPALILLELMMCGSLDAFCDAADAITRGYANGRLHKVQFSPGVVLAPLATETLPPATTTNCLIVGRDELWIVDPASPDPEEQRRLIALCDELTADGGRVAGVLSTHHHPDHVGGIAATCEHFGVTVRGHERTLSRLPAGCPLGEPLADGDRIPLGRAPDDSTDWYLEALFTPGHDRGHLCFLDSRYSALIAGDMASTVSTIMIDPPEGHLRTYLDSLTRLSRLDLGTLYPAHGPAIANGNKIVAHYLKHRAAREDALLRALTEVPTTPKELVPTVYEDTDPRMFGFAERSLVAGLEKLEEEGRARRDGERWSAIDAG